jgi:hypothetical protein
MLLTLPSSFPFMFTFSAPSPLSAPLTFPPASCASPPHRGNLKRQRSVHDIDDSTTVSRKKRRLRLLLITSRLSRPFSTPASHIVDRGSCKVAVWARQKQVGAGRLRKIAILNSVKKNVPCSPTQKPIAASVALPPLPIYPWHDSSKTAADDGRDIGGGEVNTNAIWPSVSSLVAIAAEPEEEPPIKPRRPSFEEDKAPHLAAHPSVNTLVNHPPIPPSPLGLSNYDALDEEDSFAGYYIPCDDDEEEAYLPHPDWAMPPPPASDLPVTTTLHPLPSPALSFVHFPPSPSPSPPKSESPEQEATILAEEPVISPNFAAAWRPLDEKRPPSPPDEGLLRALRQREKIREVREGGVWTGIG